MNTSEILWETQNYKKRHKDINLIHVTITMCLTHFETNKSNYYDPGCSLDMLDMFIVN